MTPHLEQRLAEIAEREGYNWPAGEIAHAMRLGAEAAIKSAIEHVESSAEKVSHEDHKVGMHVAAMVISSLLPPLPKEPNDDHGF